MIWNRERECLSREDLEHLQLERLQMTINRSLDKVGFYRQRFMDLGLEPGDVTSLADLSQLPFTTKADLLEFTPYGLLAVPLRDIIRFHSSTGTLGRTCIAGYTKDDLRCWRELMARIIAATGVTPQDIVQVTFAYGLSTGGIAFEMGAEALGASVIPAGVENVDLQIHIMKEFRPTVLAATPSFALQLAGEIERKGIDPKNLDLRIGLLGAEPWSESVRQQLDRFFFMKCHDIYGLAELIGPGVAGECPERRGLHLAEDMFLPEVIDPGTGQVLEPGREGELVLTTLMREAQPLIRYRTGDLTRLDYEPCACGRTHARMSRIFQRTDDVIIFSGISILPGEIRRVLAMFEEVLPNYEVVVSSREAPGELHVRAEVRDDMIEINGASRQNLMEKIAGELQKTTGVRFKITLLAPGTLEETGGVPGRIIRE